MDILLDGASSVPAAEQRESVAPMEPGAAPEAIEVSDIAETAHSPARRRRTAAPAEDALAEDEMPTSAAEAGPAPEEEAASTSESEESPKTGAKEAG
jgi:hypothetical protein